MGGVVHERVAVQILGKQTFAKRNAVFLAHFIKAVRFPDSLWCLNNKCRCGFIKLVSVRCKPAVFGLLKSEGERVKRLFGAEPDKPAVAQLNIRLVSLGITFADAAVQAVAGNHQVGLVLRGHRLVVLYVGFKHQLNAELQAALLQDIEQLLAADAAKAMAARTHAAPFEKQLYIVPMIESIANQLCADGISQFQVAERLV